MESNRLQQQIRRNWRGTNLAVLESPGIGPFGDVIISCGWLDSQEAASRSQNNHCYRRWPGRGR